MKTNLETTRKTEQALITVGQYEIRLTRRKYGYRWFCWAEAKHWRVNGYNEEFEWVSLGDPWPRYTPEASALLNEVKHYGIRPYSELHQWENTPD